jgi:hypothetical protein
MAKSSFGKFAGNKSNAQKKEGHKIQDLLQRAKLQKHKLLQSPLLSKKKTSMQKCH